MPSVETEKAGGVRGWRSGCIKSAIPIRHPNRSNKKTAAYPSSEHRGKAALEVKCGRHQHLGGGH